MPVTFNLMNEVQNKAASGQTMPADCKSGKAVVVQSFNDNGEASPGQFFCFPDNSNQATLTGGQPPIMLSGGGRASSRKSSNSLPSRTATVQRVNKHIMYTQH